MARFIPIIVELNDSRATPRAKGLKNALDDIDKSGTKAANGGLKNVFDATTKFSTQSIQKVDSSVKQLGTTATKVGNDTKEAFKKIENSAESTARGAANAFTQFLGAAFFATLFHNILRSALSFGKDFISQSITLAQDLKNALLGVSSIAAFKGIDQTEATAAVRNLHLVRAGIISVADASVSLKNLLQSGFGLQQSITLIERFGDTAAFGKQAALTYGEAIRSATEGIKNQNSILVDNAGITKNLEVILKERGFTMQDLSDKVKGLAAREALYQGFLAESQGQLGDAIKLTNTYTGVVAAEDKAYQDLQRTLGDIIITNPALIESSKLVAEQLNDTTRSIQDQDSESAKFVKNAVYYYALIKANIAPFGAFMVNLAKLVFHGLGVLHSAFWGTIGTVTQTLINGMAKSIEVVLNLLIAGINKITDTARKLPSDMVGPIAALQSVGPIASIKSPTAINFADSFFKQLSLHIDGLKRADEGMTRASAEGIEAGRRLRNAIADAEFMAKLDRESPRTAGDARLARANELANQATGGGGGSGKKVADDFKSIANVVPVPTPSDPKLKAMIEEYAATFGVPLWVAFAQIWTESRFNKNALSPKQAKGLTQITPGTAAQYGISFKNLNDPAVALSGWGKIMSSLYAKYGSWDLALLAYHQGEKPVDRLVSIIQSGGVNEATGGFSGAAKRAGVGPLGRKYLEGINVFKSNPLAEQESPFLGMAPQQIVKAVLTTDVRGNQRPLATESDQLAQLPINLERQWNRYYESAAEGAKALAERRQDIDAEYLSNFKNLTTELGNLEIDLALIRRENVDDQFTEQRRLLLARGEEKDLLLSIRQVQDEIATGPYNESLRIQLALLQDIADIRRRDEDAIKEQNRAQLELADAGIFHAQQAREIVLRHLLQARSQTEVFSDAIIDAYEGINDAVLSGVQRITGGIKVLDNLIAGLTTRITNRVFQKLLDVLIPAGPGAGGTVGFSPGGGGAGNLPAALLGSFIRPGGAGITNPQQAQAAALSSIFGGGITPPVSLTSQLAQQQALSGAIEQSGAVGGLGTAAASRALTPAGGQVAGLNLAGLAASLPLFGALMGATTWLGILQGNVSGTQAAVGGGVLGFLFGRNKARRRDETSRNQAMLDSLGQLNQILSAVKSDRMDGGQAIAAAVQVRSEYVSAMSELKDKKTREIALKDVSRLDLVIGQIRSEADRQLKRKEIDDRFKPEFKHGGDFMSDYFLPKFAGNVLNLPRASRGLFELPGAFDQRDDMVMRVSRGERVAVMTPQQYSRIGGRKTFEDAGVPALAAGGFSPGASSQESSKPPINLNVYLDIPGLKPGLILEEATKTPEGYEALTRVWNKAKKEGRGNVR